MNSRLGESLNKDKSDRNQFSLKRSLAFAVIVAALSGTLLLLAFK